MKMFEKLTLSQKVLGIEIAVFLMSLAPTTFLEIAHSNSQLETQSNQRIELSTSELVNNLKVPLWNYSHDEANHLISNAVKSSIFKRIAVFDSDGKLVGEASHPDYKSKQSEELKRNEILYNERKIGTVEFLIDLSDLAEKKQVELIELIARNLFLVISALSLTYLFLQHFVLKRISLLESQACKLSAGILDQPFNWSGHDEISILGKGLDDARISLKSAFESVETSNTQLKKMNSELQILVAQKTAQAVQSAKLASLGEMSSGIAHEINNPLAIIQGMARTLPKAASNPAVLEQKVASINKAIQRISKIVTGLRKFSRTSQKTDLRLFSLKDIINEAMVLTEPKSKRHSTPISVFCDFNPVIMCNEIEIEQVLVNLVNNGIDAVKTKEERWIKIEIQESENEIILRVQDSGPGIPSAVAEKLFQPFFTTKPVGEGTGLGLSIIKGILDEHKAKIQLLTDHPNTCFQITFNKPKEVSNAA